MVFDDNVITNNIDAFLKMHEAFVESMKLYQKMAQKYFTYFNEMMDISIKTMERGDNASMQYYSAYATGYEAAKKEFMDSIKEMQNIKEPANLYS